MCCIVDRIHTICVLFPRPKAASAAPTAPADAVAAVSKKWMGTLRGVHASATAASKHARKTPLRPKAEPVAMMVLQSDQTGLGIIDTMCRHTPCNVVRYSSPGWRHIGDAAVIP